jgi:hypothetical protein
MLGIVTGPISRPLTVSLLNVAFRISTMKESHRVSPNVHFFSSRASIR